MPTDVRILADDLTGALDTAARFVPLVGPVLATWRTPPVRGPMALDSMSRDADATTAAAAVRALAPALAGADIAFKKIDSLLRGHVAAELAACHPLFDHIVLAPAFPFQGRVTRGGRQFARTAGGWQAIDVDPGFPLHDAEIDDDLDRIVRQGLALPGRVLWCGTAGLAGALTRVLGGCAPPPTPLPAPVLALIGSDHPVTLAQLGRLGARHHRIGPHHATPIAAPAAVSVALAPGTPRATANQVITAAFRRQLDRPDRPGTLFVSGGETLRQLCDALNVAHLEVVGEHEPGIPVARLRGGAWDGQMVAAKSGAFGSEDCLARIL